MAKAKTKSMATKKIAEVDVNIEAMKPLSPEHRAAVFAHLHGEEKEKAVAELEAAVKELDKK